MRTESHNLDVNYLVDFTRMLGCSTLITNHLRVFASFFDSGTGIAD